MASEDQGRGAGGPSVALDMSVGKDREYLRTAIARGWGITAKDLMGYKMALDQAMAISLDAHDAREINACVKTMVSIVGQIQADEHLEVKVEAEKDKPPAQNIFVLNVPSPRALESQESQPSP